MTRNLILTAAAFLLSTAVMYPQQIELFNGRDLSNWNFVLADKNVSPNQVFTVNNGEILIKGQPFGYMYTKEKYANFLLEIEWRWDGEASNSGIFLMIAETANPFPNAIECQLKAGNAGDFVLLNGAGMAEYKTPESGRPAFPVIPKRTTTNEKPVGEWNKALFVSTNGQITVYINGTVQNAGTPTTKKGHIGLQSEGGKIRFRNVKLTAI